MFEDNRRITITNLIKHFENKTNIKKSHSTGFLIFVKFELHDPPKKPFCLKKFLVKYKDSEQFHHHTLKNIVSFNNVNVENPDAYLDIAFFENNKMKHIKIPFHDINDMHINYFNKSKKLLEN